MTTFAVVTLVGRVPGGETRPVLRDVAQRPRNFGTPTDAETV